MQKKELKAKINYRCDICGGMITIGDKFLSIKHKGDTYILHKECLYLLKRQMKVQELYNEDEEGELTIAAEDDLEDRENLYAYCNSRV